MQIYQVKVLPQGTFLYGGAGIAAPNEQAGATLIVKNDRFGEQVELKIVKQQPAQPQTVTNLGVLDRDQTLMLSLQYVLRVEANTVAPNLDSFVSCVIVQGQH